MLHFSDLAKEQHDEQHKAVSDTTAALSPCTVCADWAVRVEGKMVGGKDKPSNSASASRPRPTASSAPSTSSLSSWSIPVPLPPLPQPMHHTALADAFPLPPPPAPSHTHHKRKSDADEADRPGPSVRVRSAEIDDSVEKARVAETTGLEATVRQREEDAERGNKERQGRQREQEMKAGRQHVEKAQVTVQRQQQDEQGSRHELLKQAVLEQHTTVTSSGGAATHVSKPAVGVVYLQTISPSQDHFIAPDVSSLTPKVPYTTSVPAGALVKGVEAVAVLRPSAGDGGSSNHKTTAHASSTAPLPRTTAQVPAPTVAEDEDGANAESGAAEAGDELQRDGSTHSNSGNGGNGGNGGRGGQTGNGNGGHGGSRKRGGNKGRR